MSRQAAMVVLLVAILIVAFAAIVFRPETTPKALGDPVGEYYTSWCDQFGNRLYAVPGRPESLRVVPDNCPKVVHPVYRQ